MVGLVCAYPLSLYRESWLNDLPDELRQKAVRTAIAVVSGAYQTVLVSYFINRDFFPSLMKVPLIQHRYFSHNEH